MVVINNIRTQIKVIGCHLKCQIRCVITDTIMWHQHIGHCTFFCDLCNFMCQLKLPREQKLYIYKGIAKSPYFHFSITVEFSPESLESCIKAHNNEIKVINCITFLAT